MAASYQGLDYMVEMLIKHRADVHVVTKGSGSALDMAFWGFQFGFGDKFVTYETKQYPAWRRTHIKQIIFTNATKLYPGWVRTFDLLLKSGDKFHNDAETCFSWISSLGPNSRQYIDTIAAAATAATRNHVAAGRVESRLVTPLPGYAGLVDLLKYGARANTTSVGSGTNP
jgi:hypothetical protein